MPAPGHLDHRVTHRFLRPVNGLGFFCQHPGARAREHDIRIAAMVNKVPNRKAPSPAVTV